MARETLPQEGKKTCVSESSMEAALGSLRDVDAFVQSNTETIMAMSKAAKAMLALDAGALVTVSILLNHIHELAFNAGDMVSCEAERHGVNYLHPKEEDTARRLYAQHSEIGLTAKAEVSHV